MAHASSSAQGAAADVRAVLGAQPPPPPLTPLDTASPDFARIRAAQVALFSSHLRLESGFPRVEPADRGPASFARRSYTEHLPPAFKDAEADVQALRDALGSLTRQLQAAHPAVAATAPSWGAGEVAPRQQQQQPSTQPPLAAAAGVGAGGAPPPLVAHAPGGAGGVGGHHGAPPVSAAPAAAPGRAPPGGAPHHNHHHTAAAAGAGGGAAPWGVGAGGGYRGGR